MAEEATGCASAANSVPNPCLRQAQGCLSTGLIGIFPAILELVRRHHIRVEQNALFGEIRLLPNPTGGPPPDFSSVDEYEHQAVEA